MAIKCGMAVNAAGTVPGTMEVPLWSSGLLAANNRNSLQETGRKEIYRNHLGWKRKVEKKGHLIEKIGT